jgi:glycosyltransferase involved in cell wall biosynthesis
MHKQIINLIEPTLYDQTGHSYGYVLSLINANNEFNLDMQVWLDRRGKDLLKNTSGTAHAYFFRPLRQLQKLFLYLKLIKSSETIFISTTELWDLKILAFYTKHFATKARVILHFHQFKQTASKLAALRAIAPIAKNFTILTPTDRLTKVFKTNGFNCKTVPCPVFSTPRNITHNNAKFTKILYAGAARRDKGFPTVISLLQHFRTQQNNITFEIQISAPNSQRYDAATQQALQLLQNLPIDNLILHKETLDQSQYLDLFNNSICLLLYDKNDYSDKFSGVALDAFYAGCPIITSKNTWMGDTAEQYQAGIALDNYDNTSVQQAAEQIISNYAQYHENAKKAALELSAAHDPRNTLASIHAVLAT